MWEVEVLWRIEVEGVVFGVEEEFVGGVEFFEDVFDKAELFVHGGGAVDLVAAFGDEGAVGVFAGDEVVHGAPAAVVEGVDEAARWVGPGFDALGGEGVGGVAVEDGDGGIKVGVTGEVLGLVVDEELVDGIDVRGDGGLEDAVFVGGPGKGEGAGTGEDDGAGRGVGGGGESEVVVGFGEVDGGGEAVGAGVEGEGADGGGVMAKNVEGLGQGFVGGEFERKIGIVWDGLRRLREGGIRDEKEDEEWRLSHGRMVSRGRRDREGVGHLIMLVAAGCAYAVFGTGMGFLGFRGAAGCASVRAKGAAGCASAQARGAAGCASRSTRVAMGCASGWELMAT